MSNAPGSSASPPKGEPSHSSDMNPARAGAPVDAAQPPAGRPAPNDASGLPQRGPGPSPSTGSSEKPAGGQPPRFPPHFADTDDTGTQSDFQSSADDLPLPRHVADGGGRRNERGLLTVPHGEHRAVRGSLSDRFRSGVRGVVSARRFSPSGGSADDEKSAQNSERSATPDSQFQSQGWSDEVERKEKQRIREKTAREKARAGASTGAAAGESGPGNPQHLVQLTTAVVTSPPGDKNQERTQD